MSLKQGLWVVLCLFMVQGSVPDAASAAAWLRYEGTLRDRVGQGNAALAPDSYPDGTFTVTFSPGSGTRMVTRLELKNTAGGTWDTSPETRFWALGVATSVDGPLYGASSAMNVVVSDGDRLTLFASDSLDPMFLDGTFFTLSMTFADGSQETTLTSVDRADPALSLHWDGMLADRVGRGNGWRIPDGSLDGGFTLTLDESQGPRTIVNLELRSSGGGVWDTNPATPFWVLGVASEGGGAFYQSSSDTVNFTLAPGASIALFAADWDDRMFVNGAMLIVRATYLDGTVGTATAMIGASAPPPSEPPPSEPPPSAPPEIASAPASVAVTAPAPATFTVTATGAAPISYQWQKNGVDIAGATDSSYTTAPTTTEDSGSTLRVVVANPAGTVTSGSATLLVNAAPDLTPPSIPGAIAALANGCHDASVSWDPVSDDAGGSGLKGYNVYRNGVFAKQVLAPATRTPDADLTAATSYSYTIAAIDNAGNESAQSAPATASTPACQGAATPALVGVVPGIGAARDVVIDPGTGLAYVASGEFGLAVADVSNPAAPVAIGTANLPFYGERLAVDGGLAVVTSNTLGLYVVDVSDPAAPSVQSSLTGTMRGVAVAGRYAYVLQIVPGNPARSDLVVVDLQRPEDPAVVGRVTLAGGWAVRVAGSFVYVAADTAGLQIVDVSNPAAPWILSTLDTPGAARDVAVAGGYAYVADTTSVQIVRVTNPSSPVVVGALATSATAIAAAGTRLYALGSSQFKVIDVASPAAPALRSAIDSRSSQGVGAAGTLAFLASATVDAAQNKGGLYVVDATVPTAPVVRSNLYGGFDNTGIAVSNGVAVATGNSLGLKVVDVSNPLLPRLRGVLAGTMKGVAMEGSYAYVLQLIPGNPAHVDLLVVDLVSATPVVVGRVSLAWGLSVRVRGGFAYVAADTVGLLIVNISNPAAPWVVATLDTPGSARAVALANGYAYVADDSSVQVIDIRTPSNPVIAGSLATTATAIAAAGSYVYALGSGQFKVLDATNPTVPVLVSATTGYSAQALDVTGTLAFLATPALSHADTKGGVYVLDVTSPGRPALVEQIAVPGTTRSVVAAGGFVYAGDSMGIVDVIQVTP